jgi:uncharacterized coiled-coil protein SlyX
MTRHIFRSMIVIGLAAGLTACSSKPSETDQKIAELQKQLDATKQELAAKGAEAGAAASGAAQTAAAAASESAENREAAERAAQSASDRASRDRAATEQALASQNKALAEQQAATARQADENERLRREMEAMKPREFTVPTGTALPVRTTAEISTKSMTTGATFDALLERDLVVDGTVLAKAGSSVICVVANSDPGGKVKGVASMSVRVRSITGADGQPVAIKTSSYSVAAKSTAKKDVARTGIATGAGAVIGAIAGGGKGAAIGAGVGAAGGTGVAMATRGDPAVIPTETLIEFQLTAPATIVLRKQ